MSSKNSGRIHPDNGETGDQKGSASKGRDSDHRHTGTPQGMPKEPLIIEMDFPHQDMLSRPVWG